MMNGCECTVAEIDVIMSFLLNETEIEIDTDMDEGLVEGNILNGKNILSSCSLADNKAEQREVEFKKKRLAIATIPLFSDTGENPVWP